MICVCRCAVWFLHGSSRGGSVFYQPCFLLKMTYRLLASGHLVQGLLLLASRFRTRMWHLADKAVHSGGGSHFLRGLFLSGPSSSGRSAARGGWLRLVGFSRACQAGLSAKESPCTSLGVNAFLACAWVRLRTPGFRVRTHQFCCAVPAGLRRILFVSLARSLGA